mmetsp:Transcript_18341/g.20194  ORF Transcript_18341/g.20194 Transcript_18341/m.20194 type:complete len:234 (-) Transcript_18341:79-780(-)
MNDSVDTRSEVTGDTRMDGCSADIGRFGLNPKRGVSDTFPVRKGSMFLFCCVWYGVYVCVSMCVCVEMWCYSCFSYLVIHPIPKQPIDSHSPFFLVALFSLFFFFPSTGLPHRCFLTFTYTHTYTKHAHLTSSSIARVVITSLFPWPPNHRNRRRKGIIATVAAALLYPLSSLLSPPWPPTDGTNAWFGVNDTPLVAVHWGILTLWWQQYGDVDMKKKISLRKLMTHKFAKKE